MGEPRVPPPGRVMITSPCTGVCTMDPTTGWCLGCGRTRDELVGWGSRPTEARHEVWRALPARLDTLGVALRRPDWDREAMVDALLERFRHGGEWSICDCAGFSTAALRDPEITMAGATLGARQPGRAIRVKIDQHLRAFNHPDPGRGAEALILGVLRLRLPDERDAVLTEVGPDKKPLLDEDADGVLFDLGLGFPPARFMLRTADQGLQRALRALAGAPLARVIAEAGEALDAARPTRVAQSAGARIECATPPPAPDGPAAAGGHATMLAALRRSLRDAPPPLAIGDAHAPVAIHRAATIPPA